MTAIIEIMNKSFKRYLKAFQVKHSSNGLKIEITIIYTLKADIKFSQKSENYSNSVFWDQTERGI